MPNFIKVTLFLFLIPLLLANIPTVSSILIRNKNTFLDKSTTCEDFGKNASFNPNSVADDEWFVFYYWASVRPSKSFKFRLLKDRDLPYLHYWLDTHVAKNFSWTANMVLIEDQTNLHSNLLVEDHGVYWIYLLSPNLPPGEMMLKFEVRVKGLEDNKYVAVMDCQEQSAFLMSKIKEVPPKEKIEDEAAKLGYRGIPGRSYLVDNQADQEDWADYGQIKQIRFRDIKHYRKNTKRHPPTFE